jgi:hypothetical protein
LKKNNNQPRTRKTENMPFKKKNELASFNSQNMLENILLMTHTEAFCSLGGRKMVLQKN